MCGTAEVAAMRRQRKACDTVILSMQPYMSSRDDPADDMSDPELRRLDSAHGCGCVRSGGVRNVPVALRDFAGDSRYSSSTVAAARDECSAIRPWSMNTSRSAPDKDAWSRSSAACRRRS